MKNTRIISRIDLNNGQLVKGKLLEGLRKLGDPIPYLKSYYFDKLDEIILLDAVASLYERSSNYDFLKEVCKEFFIPITIGGGIKSIKDVDDALNSGADKVAINSAIVKDIKFLDKVVSIWGSSTIVGSINARRHRYSWQIFTDNAKHRVMTSPFEWANKIIDHGIGEIMLTSIDNDGLEKGFDMQLINKFDKIGKVPYLVSGGAGTNTHVIDLIKSSNCSGVVIGSALHYKKITVKELKKDLFKNNIESRR
jgi:imidazole glycerol-phosphate synthase subunit HisF